MENGRRKETGIYFRAKISQDTHTGNLRVHTWLPSRSAELCLTFPSLWGCSSSFATQGAVSQSPTTGMKISYPPSTYRKMLHMNLIFVATQRKTQRCHLLPLIVERPSFPTWHSQKQPEDPDASILPGSVKVVNIIQLLEIEKQGWKNKKNLLFVGCLCYICCTLPPV